MCERHLTKFRKDLAFLYLVLEMDLRTLKVLVQALLSEMNEALEIAQMYSFVI